MSKYALGSTVEVSYASGSTQLGARDAFHVAGILCSSYAGLPVRRGDGVRFMDPTMRTVRACRSGEFSHGIVDPFLDRPGINPGEMFWVILPQQHTRNLSHHFEVCVPGMVEQQPLSVEDKPLDAEADDDDDWCKTDCEN